MKRPILTTIVPVVLACAGTTAQKRELQPLSVYGRVVDGATNAAVSSALVDLDSTSWGTFTDSTGKFELRGLPSGGYTVRMRSPCDNKLVLATHVVELTDTAAVRVDFVVALDSLSRCQVVWFRGVH